MAEDERDEGIRVTDRRVSAQPDDEDGKREPTEDDKRGAARRADEVPAEDENVPPIDFNTFILSLSASAAMHLGMVPDSSGQTRVNLPMARQTIDLLAVLEKKTEGNLTGEEERLLAQVLYDLRMQFVAKSRKK